VKIGALEIIADGKATDVVVLLQDVTLIGREQGDFVIDDEEASSEHCQIQRTADRYHVLDLSSTNGTFVNGLRISDARLAPGDEIRIGQTKLRFTDVTLVSEPSPHELALGLCAGRPRPSGEAGVLLDQIERIRSDVLPRSILVLDVIYEDGLRQILRFENGKAELGRQMDKGRFRDDQELSKIHATIRVGDRGEVFVYDHMSTNGTFVNETRVKGERLVVPGDTVRIGRTRIWCRPELPPQ
jgi:pSer/pThr/pTyr-binding forkhead associated (FHA) protein